MAAATQRTLGWGEPCPAGRTCGYCNVSVVLDRGPLHYVYTPLLPQSGGGLVGGSRDGSGVQNQRLWTLGAALSAGFYSAQARWANVWWNAAAAVAGGGFGLQAAPRAEVPQPPAFQDILPPALASYYALVPGWPASRAERGTGGAGSPGAHPQRRPPAQRPVCEHQLLCRPAAQQNFRSCLAETNLALLAAVGPD